jgi:hypothetical protein
MAKGLKTLAALGGLGAAAYLAGKMGGKKDEDVDTTADASAGMAKTRLGKDESNYDELANMDRTKAARQGKASKEYGKSMTKKAAPKAASAAAPTRKANAATSAASVPTPSIDLRRPSSAPSALRPGAKAVVENTPGEFDRMMAQKKLDAEKDRLFKEGMRRRAETSEIDEDSGGIGERIIGAKRGGKIKAKKYVGGGSVGGASKRADGCAMRGKTKGRMV